MRKFVIATSAFFLASSPTVAQEANDSVKTMIDKLVPKDVDIADVGTGPVLTLRTATKDEIVNRLSFSPSRSLQSLPKAAKLPLVKGQESELLEALRGLPSMQVAVAFQGASDALAPEAGALLSDLGQALASPKLANSRVVIGVHTNSIGSDEYNLDLSSLRAKAIVDMLVAVHGISRDRLAPFGFGRTRDSTMPSAAADERIQVVNLGPVAQDAAPIRPETPAPTVVAKPVPSASPPPPPTITQIPARPAYTHYARTPPAYVDYNRRPPAYVYYDRGPPGYPHYGPPPNFHGSLTTRRSPEPPPIVSQSARHFEQQHKRRWPQWVDSPPPERGAPQSYSSDAGPPPGANYGAPESSNDGSYGYSPSVTGGPGNMGGNMGANVDAGVESNGPSLGHNSYFHRRSDRRLKRYIRRVGQSERGFILYSFQYIWGGPFYVGVMAQDLLSTYPEAVSVGPDGYLMVDYAKLDVDMTTLAEWEAASRHAATHMAPAGL